jgi:dTDP-4-dehydrorhamnose reductase
MNYQKNKVVLFDDIVFNPIYMPDLVDIIVGVIGGKHHGIFNIGSSGSCMTKAEYIIKIINKLHLKSIKTVFGKMSESEFITAPRPLDMCMSINKAQENLGVKLLSLEESIDQISVDYKYKQDI